LADRVRHVERLRAEKARTHKYKREKVSYVETNKSDQEFVIAFEDVEDGEVNVVELKLGPHYTCKLLRPSDGKNPVETKNDKYSNSSILVLRRYMRCSNIRCKESRCSI